MPVTDITKDLDALTMVVTAEFDTLIDRVWQMYADPRQLERWWGPPTHPATVTRHDLTAGGHVAYYMTDPDGQRYHGLWAVTDVDAPRSFSVEDRFADDEGKPVRGMPVSTMAVELTNEGGGTHMTVTSTWATRGARGGPGDGNGGGAARRHGPDRRRPCRDTRPLTIARAVAARLDEHPRRRTRHGRGTAIAHAWEESRPGSTTAHATPLRRSSPRRSVGPCPARNGAPSPPPAAKRSTPRSGSPDRQRVAPGS
ncbi:hypothetical protein BH23ACT9_BH23ACT9_17030 [soil metagenome]